MKRAEEVLKLIQNSVGRKRKTFGHGFESAYHTIKLGDEIFEGQRDISKRLANVKYDFKDKVVLDVGCNIGGMLHSLSSDIKYGIGVDYNAKAIKAANAIKEYNDVNNLDFYTFDLQKENLQKLKGFRMADQVDICMVLAIALWVKNWEEVVRVCHVISPALLYESNGNDEFQNQQYEFLKSMYKDVKLIADKSEDDNRKGGKAKMRKTFICGR